MHASNEPIFGHSDDNDGGDNSKGDCDGGIQIPGASSKPGPSKADHADGQIGGVNKCEHEEDKVSFVSRVVKILREEYIPLPRSHHSFVG